MLCTDYPEEKIENLPYSYSFKQYRKLCPYKINDGDFKIESHPFWYYESYDGFMHFQFSCLSTVNYINYQLEFQNGTCVYGSYVKIEFLPSKRKRFIIHVAFPEKGIYNLNIWLDFKYVLTYYIKSYVQ